MSAFRIFRRFAELLDIKVTRAAAAWLRLNTDGTVTERTAAQTLSDIGAAATSHAHGSITADGKVGTTSGLPLKTGTAGVVEAGAFGTTAGTFAEGNDSRITGALPASGGTATNPTITNYTESVVAIGNSGSTQTLDLTSGTVQTCTLTASCTFTMPTATAGKSFVLYLKTGAGSYTAAFTGVKWTGGTAPTITATASRMDILTFVADGTNWYGQIAQNYTP
jgi:hypothetical protein